MKVLAVLLVFTSLVAISTAGNIVCYFKSWAIYRTGNGQFAAKDIDPTLCTHVNYAFVGLNENGTVHILDDWDITGLLEIQHLMSLKEENPDLKIMLSMGGWNEGSTVYSAVAADPDKRATLVQDVIAFLGEHGFDGFDLYWQYPGQREGDPEIDPVNFVTLLGELKTALNAKDYLLSANVAGVVASIDISYPDGKAVTDNLDLLNVMSYDYHGTWEEWVGQNAPLYSSSLDRTDAEKLSNVASGIQHWIDIGADPAKINMGIGTYGHSFILANISDTDLYAPATGPGDVGPYTQESGVLGYNEICELYGDQEPIWDDEQKVPRLVIEDLWIGYDNEESIQIKIEYANEMGLGGVSVWSPDTDDFLGTCGEKYPLLNTIKANLN